MKDQIFGLLIVCLFVFGPYLITRKRKCIYANHMLGYCIAIAACALMLPMVFPSKRLVYHVIDWVLVLYVAAFFFKRKDANPDEGITDKVSLKSKYFLNFTEYKNKIK